MARMGESLDGIMADFRSNGRDVEYMELDLDAIELDQYVPAARKLILGLLAQSGSGLDPEMKIVRPPSKTPHHLPTSTINLMKKSQRTPPSPPAYPTWNTHYVGLPVQQVPVPLANPGSHLDLSQRMSHLTLSDRRFNFCISPPPTNSVSVSGPIFGSGATLKPSFAGLRQPHFWKWGFHPFNSVDPGRSPLHVSMNRDSVKSLETPVVTVVKNCNWPQKTKEGEGLVLNISKGCSEEDFSIGAESFDSGHCTAAELSPGSDLSTTSTSGSESNAPSYASVLNTPATTQSGGPDKPTEPSTEVSPETPKSHQAEGLKTQPWNLKKFRQPKMTCIKECGFCKTNGEMPSVYRGHVLKDEEGRTVCHVLQKYVCPLCGATGENAHTVKYCPQNANPPAVSAITILKTMRSATGKIRRMSNSRRTRASTRRYQKRCSPGVSSFGVA